MASYPKGFIGPIPVAKPAQSPGFSYQGNSYLPSGAGTNPYAGTPQTVKGYTVQPYQNSGQVKGVSMGGGSPPAPPSGQGAPAGNNNQGGGGQVNPIGPASMDQINPYFDQANALYEGQVAPVTQSEADQEAAIKSGAAVQHQQANQGFAQQTTDLGNAADQARRQASEILQGIQGRYGGTTGEGSFASTQLGAQTTQNLAQIQQKVQQVHQVAQIAGQDIEQKALEQTNAAKQWLQQTLSSIRQNQATLQSHKADLAYAAMSQYQQYLEQVNLAKQNQQSYLAAQTHAAQLGLQGYLAQGQGYVNSVNPIQGIPGMGGQAAPNAYNQGSTPGFGVAQQQKQTVDQYGNPIPQ